MWVFCRLRNLSEIAQAMFYRYCGRTYECDCGHTTKWKTLMIINGHQGVYRVPSKKPDYCPQCWAKAGIRCAWCGDIILPGDAVTLYTPKEGFEIPKYAVVYQHEPYLQLVGCLDWNCAAAFDRAGFWVMPGKVQRVMSPLEILAAYPDADAIIINDLTDPQQSIPMPNEES